MTRRILKKQRRSEGLPDDILQSIAQRLYILDYIVFRQICPSWRAAIDRGIATRSCPPAPQFPWLLLLDSYGLYSGNNHDYMEAFYIEYQYYFLRSPISFSSKPSSASCIRSCVRSAGSWLIASVRKQLYSYNFWVNPVSRARVKLPSCSFTLIKSVASSPPAPTTNPFVAALLCPNGLAVCRPTDASWTLVKNKHDLPYKDLEIIDLKLYAVGKKSKDRQYTVQEFDMLSEHDNVTIAKYNCRISIDIPYSYFDGEEIQFACIGDSTSKELFVVLYSCTIRRVRVYKIKSNTDGKLSCEVFTNLGDRILFLSGRSNKVINDKTLGKNCIYFAFKLEEGFWVYNLTIRSFKSVHLPRDYSSQSCGATLWFTPHPW